MSFETDLARDQARVEALLAKRLPAENVLDEAMRHAVLAGGKRLRAFLVYESARLCGLELEAADAGAMAIELMHAYSLIHDDLPAMDDDALRRGQPTLHVKWNEYTAILAGDALQSLSFEVLASSPIAPANRLNVIQSFAQAAGAQGMVRGQFFDLESESQNAALSLDDLQNLQRDKTGALISWSAQFGARAQGLDPAPFAQYAKHLGLAFQIWDDVLDVEASAAILGKTAGKDEAAGKATYVSLLGLENAKTHAKGEIDAAKRAISELDGIENLIALANFVISRTH